MLRQELTPTEDRAVAILRINGPQGISVEFLQSQLEKIETAIQPLRDSGEILTTYGIAGSGGSSNNGFMVLTLAPWKERSRSQQEIMADITARVRGITAVRIFTAQPNSLGIRGAGNGLQFAVLGTDYAKLRPATDAIVAALEKTRVLCSHVCRLKQRNPSSRSRSIVSAHPILALISQVLPMRFRRYLMVAKSDRSMSVTEVSM